MTNLANVDIRRCEQVAGTLMRIQVPPPKEEMEVDALQDLDLDQAANLFLLQIAICHQTQDLAGTVDGTAYRGWDYLTRRAAKAASSDLTLVDPANWSDFKLDQLADLLGSTAISRSEERVGLIRNLGIVLTGNGWKSANELYAAAGGWLRREHPAGLLRLLAQLDAYADPVRKKSYFLLGLMKAKGFWTYADDDQLLPPVDYHEIRGHLRLGTVVLDAGLRGAIEKRIPISNDADRAIRQAVLDAIVEISRLSRLDSMTLHYFFWNIFRGICTRAEPQCMNAIAGSVPDRYRSFLDAENHSCGFRNVCASAGMPDPISEYEFLGHWY